MARKNQFVREDIRYENNAATSKLNALANANMQSRMERTVESESNVTANVLPGGSLERFQWRISARESGASTDDDANDPDYVPSECSTCSDVDDEEVNAVFLSSRGMQDRRLTADTDGVMTMTPRYGTTQRTLRSNPLLVNRFAKGSSTADISSTRSRTLSARDSQEQGISQHTTPIKSEVIDLCDDGGENRDRIANADLALSPTLDSQSMNAEISFRLQKLARRKARFALEKKQAEIEVKQLDVEDEEAELREKLRKQRHP